MELGRGKHDTRRHEKHAVMARSFLLGWTLVGKATRLSKGLRNWSTMFTVRLRIREGCPFIDRFEWTPKDTATSLRSMLWCKDLNAPSPEKINAHILITL